MMFIRHRTLFMGVLMSSLLLLIVLLSWLWTPYDPTKMNIPERFLGISANHWLGTDQYGRDILSLLMVGSRNSLLVAMVAVGLGMGLGVSLGLITVRQNVFSNELMMRFNDFIFAFPALLTAMMITAIAGAGAINIIIAIGIFNIPVFARLTRAAALSLWQREFILAARLSGKNSLSITLVHIVPNITGLILVQATTQFSLAILAEAGLSYLGLGTPPPTPSLGRMLYESQAFIYEQPMLAIYPGMTVMLSVISINMLGDGLRDLLDLHLR